MSADKKKAGVERRKYIRLSAKARVEYTIVGGGGLSGRSTTKDMSREGIRFTVREKLGRGALLDLSIDTRKGEPLILARVKTVWCKRVEEKGEFDVGALLIDIDPVDKDRLLDYAYRSWVEKAREDHRKNRSR